MNIATLQTLYDAVPYGLGQLSASRIATVSVDTWDALLRDLGRQPELVHSIDPRKFEELVAELLNRSGLIARITPATRDGGRDILAFHETAVGSHLYLVECKRYRPDRPVAVSLVRQLYGVVTQERATAGLLVTTSHFTTDALRFRETIRNQLTLKDYHQLAAWIRKCSGHSASKR